RSSGNGGADIGFDAIDNILILLSLRSIGDVLISPQKRHLWMISHSFSDLTQIPTGSRIPPHSFPSLSSSWMAKRQLGQWSGSLPCSSAGIVHPQFRHRYVSVFSFPFMAVFPLFVFGIIKK